MVLPERHVPDILTSTVGACNPRPLGGGIRKCICLIMGGSVAAGAYASNLGRTYFHQLAHRLTTLVLSGQSDAFCNGRLDKHQ